MSYPHAKASFLYQGQLHRASFQVYGIGSCLYSTIWGALRLWFLPPDTSHSFLVLFKNNLCIKDSFLDLENFYLQDSYGNSQITLEATPWATMLFYFHGWQQSPEIAFQRKLWETSILRKALWKEKHSTIKKLEKSDFCIFHLDIQKHDTN